VMVIICIRKVEKSVRKNYGFIRLIVTEGYGGLQGASAMTTRTPRLLQGNPQAPTGEPPGSYRGTPRLLQGQMHYIIQTSGRDLRKGNMIVPKLNLE
jgi:hypothetical protein